MNHFPQIVGISMSAEVTLIRYSEIGLKSAPVRRELERQLASHLKISLRREGTGDFVVKRIQGRLLVEGGVLRLWPR